MNYKFRPLPDLLDNWKNLMALEVVKQLRGELDKKRELGDINIPPMDLLSGLPALIDLLEQEAKSLKDVTRIADLVRGKKKLEEYCHNTLVKSEIHRSGNLLYRSKMALIGNILEIGIKEYRPQDIIKQMERLIFKFLDLKQDAQKIVRNNQLLQKDAWQKYDGGTTKNDLEAVYSQMLKALKSQIVEEYYQMIVVQLYTEATSLCKMYQDWAKGSLEILANIQASLEESCIKPTERIAFSCIGKVNVADQQRLLEVWVGHCVNHWSNAPVTWQQIKSKLLENLARPVEQLSDDFCAQFTQEVRLIAT